MNLWNQETSLCEYERGDTVTFKKHMPGSILRRSTSQELTGTIKV